jgi:hypothetical protein
MVYPAMKSCAQCHNDQSPTWKADRYTTKDGRKVGFDPDQAYPKIKHENPKAAKKDRPVPSLSPLPALPGRDQVPSSGHHGRASEVP